MKRLDTLPTILAAVLLLVFSGGCASAPDYTTVIVTKQAYVTTANTLKDYAREFTPDEARAIKAANDEAHAAVTLLVRKFMAGERITGTDALATLRSALVRLARYQYEAESRRAARAATRPVVRVPVDEGPLPPRITERYLRVSAHD